mgnify:CR=1 FL=1
MWVLVGDQGEVLDQEEADAEWEDLQENFDHAVLEIVDWKHEGF